MKKIVSIILILSCVLSLVACDLSDIFGFIEDELEKLHEHSWENWICTYGETEIAVICTVCDAEVISYPVSQ